MDKLEQYLDQVCRGIGGSRAMRQHIRQELAEHLRDAVAERRAAGLSEEEALARALEDFGGPEQVRSELEATHGHRFLAVVIDKAMQWKERTMKSKWLWMSWAHAALLGVIAFEALAITFAQIFLVPKFEQIMRDSGFHPAARQPDVAWMYEFLNIMHGVSRNLTWIILATAVAWGLFEWRVRSEHKTFMRLSAFGTAALALLGALVLLTGSMLILLFLGLPGALVGGGERYVEHLFVSVDDGVERIERSLAKKDWPAMDEQVLRTARAMELMSQIANRSPDRPHPLAEDRTVKVWTARQALLEARKAVAAMDAARVEAELQRFREAYAPLRLWAARLGK